jgi:peptidoglycan/xylan/chitin deacetylase (PgdA/CDA1 family)
VPSGSDSSASGAAGASGGPSGGGSPAASRPAKASPGAPASAAPGSSVPPAAPATFAAAPEGVVPILYYHRVEGLPQGFAGWNKRSQDTFLVDDLMPYAFVAQLDWLKSHGYTTMLPRDLVAHWTSGKKLPARPIILTFDDGFSNWRDFVLPQLKKRGMVAEFYVVIANVGRSITWDAVRALARAGMGIGAHDVQHFQLTGGGVPTASAAVMRYQVTEARRLIEQNTGVTVDSMAYVGGGFNATLMTIVQQAGYTSARSIERGVLQTGAIRYHLHVSRVSWHDDVTDIYTGRMVAGLPTFAQRVSGANPG